MSEDKVPALSVCGVSVSYGRRKVIDRLDLSVGRGETFGLIGLNGVGKTTLIKTILGLREPDEGKTKIFGMECASSAAKKKVSYLPERFEPPPFLTGMEFLRFSMKLYGLVADEERIAKESEFVMLAPSVLKNRVQTYSKGMRQKLGLISVFLTGCPLLILDEPMSGLDPRARALVKDALVRVHGEGRTVFLSSHILSDMSEICDRVGVLDGGNMVFTGTPEELCNRGGSDNIERAFLNVVAEKVAA